MMGLLRRLRARVRYRRFAADLEEELRVHRDMAADAHERAGETAHQARLSAQRAMGNELHVREDARAVWIAPVLDYLAQDLRLSLRRLRAAPLFATTMIGLSGLGIGALTAIFTVVNAVLFTPLPYPDADRLFALATPASGSIDGETFHAVRARTGSVATVAAFRRVSGWNVVAGRHAEFAEAMRVSADYFETIGVPPLLGRDFSDADDHANGPRVVMVSHDLWQRALDSRPTAIGELMLLGGEPYEVIGVMPEGFASVPSADIWLPLGLSPQDNTINYALFARLLPGASIAAATSALDLAKADLLPKQGEGMQARTRSLTWMTLQELTGRQFVVPSLILIGALAAILLVICANLSGLQLFRTMARRHELATRQAVGGGRRRILQQLLTESAVIALLGGVAGVAAAAAALPSLVGLMPAEVLAGRAQVLDLRVLAVAAAATMLVSIVFGIAPVLETRRLDLRSILVDGPRSTGSRHRQWGRRVLIAGELGLTMALLVLSGLLARSLVDMYRAELGFDPNGVVIAKISLQGALASEPARTRAFVDRTLGALGEIPGVASVAVANHAPIERGLNLPIEPPAGGRILHARAVDWRFVTADYFALLRIPVVAGREFQDGDRLESHAVAVVNETFARTYFGNDSPIGRSISLLKHLADPPREIVGVVADVRSRPGAGWTNGVNALGTDAPPIIYVPFAQVPPTVMTMIQGFFPTTWLVRSSGATPDLHRQIDDAIRRIEPTVAIAHTTSMAQVVDDDIAGPRALATMIGAFAILAILVASTGIFGIVAYATGQQARETAVRVALGASRASLVRQFLRETAVLAAVGTLLGVALIIAGARLLMPIIGSMATVEPTAIVVAAVTLGGSLTIAGLVPALKAINADPLQSLRGD